MSGNTDNLKRFPNTKIIQNPNPEKQMSTDACSYLKVLCPHPVTHSFSVLGTEDKV